MDRSSFTECWVGLVFSSPALGMIGHQRQMDEGGRPARQLVAELADRLEEGQALDVADGAADLAQHEIDALVAGGDEVLDGVGDVGDDLHRRAEIIAAPLLGDDLLIDAPRGDVVGLAGRDAR